MNNNVKQDEKSAAVESNKNAIYICVALIFLKEMRNAKKNVNR